MPPGPPSVPDADLVDPVADELYGLEPERFVEQRDAAALRLRTSGHPVEAKAIKALRKPSVVGWTLNLLVREDRVQVDALLSVGAELRRVMDGGLPGEELRRLTGQRHQVVRAVAARAAEIARTAGRPLSSSLTEQVARSLDAALTDPGAAQELLAGRVVGELTYAGLGDAAPEAPLLSVVRDSDTSGTDAARPASSAAEHRRALRTAERAVEDANGELGTADDRLLRARAAADAATLRAASAAQTFETIQAELETARGELAAAQHDEEVAERAVDLAAKTQERAARRLDAARERLADLTTPRP